MRPPWGFDYLFSLLPPLPQKKESLSLAHEYNTPNKLKDFHDVVLNMALQLQRQYPWAYHKGLLIDILYAKPFVCTMLIINRK